MKVRYIIIVLLLILLLFLGYIFYDRVIFKNCNIFRNIDNVEFSNIVVRRYIPYENIMFEVYDKQEIKQIIEFISTIKLRRCNKLINGNSTSFEFYSHNKQIEISVSGNIIYIDGKQYECKSNAEYIESYLFNILEKN